MGRGRDRLAACHRGRSFVSKGVLVWLAMIDQHKPHTDSI
jgi:hypothetical protein